MTISRPKVTINLVPANEAVSTGPQRVLIVGQMSQGNAVAGELVEDVGNANEWDALFGQKSMVAGMVRAFRKINRVTRVDVIPLADAVGSNSTSTISLSGEATASGKYYLTVGSYLDHRVEIVVDDGDTADIVATEIAARITAMPNVPVTASAASGVVTITYIHDGEEGNYMNIRLEGTVAGLAPSVAAFTGGATNPTLTTMFNQISDERYQTIVWPTSYNRSIILTNLLDQRFNVNNIILDGIMIQTAVDNKTNLKALANALNSQCGVIMGLKSVNDSMWKGNGAQEIPHIVSSYVAALRSLRLTQGSNIAKYVTTTTGSLDTFGGPALASLPYFNTPMDYLPSIPVGKGFSPSDIEELVDSGISTLGNNRSINKVILGDLVTTYKTDSAGNADVTFKYLNNVDVASAVREYFSNNLRKQYAQCRLTEGDLIPNRSIANAASIGGYLDKLYSDLSGTDFVLLQKGEAARKFFKENRNVSLNLRDGRVTVTMQVPIVTQLREIIATMQIAFSTNS